MAHLPLQSVGKINNAQEIVDEIFNDNNTHFLEMSGGDINPTELVAAIINQKENLIDGIHYALERIGWFFNVNDSYTKGHLCSA